MRRLTWKRTTGRGELKRVKEKWGMGGEGRVRKLDVSFSAASVVSFSQNEANASFENFGTQKKFCD